MKLLAAIVFATSVTSSYAMQLQQNGRAKVVAASLKAFRKTDQNTIIAWQGKLDNNREILVEKFYRKRKTRKVPMPRVLEPRYKGYTCPSLKARIGRKKLSRKEAKKYAKELETKACLSMWL
jgi:hypothetical protein